MGKSKRYMWTFLYTQPKICIKCIKKSFFRGFSKINKGFQYFLSLLLGQHGNLNNYVNLMKNKRSAAVCMFLLILDPKTGALYTVCTSTAYVLFVKTSVQCVHKNCNFRLFFNIFIYSKFWVLCVACIYMCL